MSNNDTELIFPARVISELEVERGKVWKELITNVLSKDPAENEHLAFILMMAKLNGCNTCSSDSFRAMRGCTQCSLQNVRRYKEDDKKLVKLYDKALIEINKSFD